METNAYKNVVNYEHQKAHRFAALLGIFGIFMAFAGLTSAYLVRKGAGQWVDFSMPTAFYASTLFILLSSFTMYVAHLSNKKNAKPLLTVGLILTLVLGLLFCFYQFQGWQQLYDGGIYMEGNPSGSFLFVITGLHVAHVAGGLLFMLFAILKSYYFYSIKKTEDTSIDGNGDKLHIRTDLLSIYWHSIDILWIYLFIFLYINLNH